MPADTCVGSADAKPAVTCETCVGQLDGVASVSSEEPVQGAESPGEKTNGAGQPEG